MATTPPLAELQRIIWEQDPTEFMAKYMARGRIQHVVEDAIGEALMLTVASGHPQVQPLAGQLPPGQLQDLYMAHLEAARSQPQHRAVLPGRELGGALRLADPYFQRLLEVAEQPVSTLKDALVKGERMSCLLGLWVFQATGTQSPSEEIRAQLGIAENATQLREQVIADNRLHAPQTWADAGYSSPDQVRKFTASRGRRLLLSGRVEDQEFYLDLLGREFSGDSPERRKLIEGNFAHAWSKEDPGWLVAVDVALAAQKLAGDTRDGIPKSTLVAPPSPSSISERAAEFPTPPQIDEPSPPTSRARTIPKVGGAQPLRRLGRRR